MGEAGNGGGGGAGEGGGKGMVGARCVVDRRTTKTKEKKQTKILVTINVTCEAPDPCQNLFERASFFFSFLFSSSSFVVAIAQSENVT